MQDKTDKNKAGFVKIHRSLFDNPLFTKYPEFIGPWVWIIAKARFKANGIGRGQLELSRRLLHKQFPHLSLAKCQRFFDQLIDQQMIKIDPQPGQKVSIVTVCNYEIYQSFDAPADPQSDPQSPKIDPQSDPSSKNVSKNGKKDISSNDDILFAFDQFKKFAQKNGMPVPRKLEPERKRKIAARLKKFKRQGWIKALRIAERCDRILENNWFTIDWLSRNNSNITKVLEGNYENKLPAKPKTPEEIANQKFIEKIKRESQDQQPVLPANGGSLLQ